MNNSATDGAAPRWPGRPWWPALLSGVLAFGEAAWSAPSWGQPDCGQWLQTQNQSANEWLLGFLSGMSLRAPLKGKRPSLPLNAMSSVEEPLALASFAAHQGYLSMQAIVAVAFVGGTLGVPDHFLARPSIIGPIVIGGRDPPWRFAFLALLNFKWVAGRAG